MFRNALKTVLILTPFVAFSGCADISPGKLTAVQPVAVASNNRVGHAYLFRGFIGVFSTGINALGDELNKDGVEATVFQADQWDQVADTIADRYKNGPVEPVVLVGHSYGADNVVRIAQRLNEKNVRIDLLITLDPVTPPKVPANVVQTIDLYQSNGAMDALPWLRGIPLEPESPKVAILNENIRTDRKDLLASGLNHFNIEKQPLVHAEVQKLIKAVCMTRLEWAAAHAVPAPTQLAEKPARVPATQSAINDVEMRLMPLASSR